jgi:prolyl 4-hydroxylase
VEPAISRASFQIKSTDRTVGPVENLSQVFALGSPGEIICLKKSRKNECLAEFTISDDGPLVFDCNKDYSAITDYGREPECGGLHKYLPHELSKYYQILNHLKFKYGYRKLTGRNYLAGDPRAISTGGTTPRDMWPADYLGQEHTTVAAVTGHRGLAGDHIQNDTAMGKISMTLKVLSGKPRVFQIESFLSEVEIDYILSAAKEEFHEDTTGKQTAVLHRPMSSVIDTICSRASDLLQVKERMTSKQFDSIVVQRTIATLTDFDTASTHADSERGVQLISKSVYMRYATLVLFLNEPTSGGELRFPLAVDHASSIPLTIPPKKASAILFYSILPDGNLDQRSIWEISNVEEGERWIATLTIAEDMNFY